MFKLLLSNLRGLVRSQSAEIQSHLLIFLNVCQYSLVESEFM